MTQRSRDPEKINVRVKNLGVGIWIDGNGDGHIDIPEMLKAAGLAVTPENRTMARDLAQRLLAAHPYGDNVEQIILRTDYHEIREAPDSEKRPG